eukprot:6255991-Pyramimonas_sp.AAC.1
MTNLAQHRPHSKSVHADEYTQCEHGSSEEEVPEDGARDARANCLLNQLRTHVSGAAAFPARCEHLQTDLGQNGNSFNEAGHDMTSGRTSHIETRRCITDARSSQLEWAPHAPCTCVVSAVGWRSTEPRMARHPVMHMHTLR